MRKTSALGRKFTIKMWNVGRFIRLNLDGFDPTAAAPSPAQRTDVDRWLLNHLAQTITDVTAAFDQYDFMQAHQVASKFFWSIYCDRYIEMIKDRFLVRDQHTESERASAQWTLWESYRVVLSLFAPFTPYITENMYQQFYRGTEDAVSVHQSGWPTVDEEWRGDTAHIEAMVNLLDAIRGQRTKQRIGNNTRVAKIVLDARTPESKALLESIAEPLRVAAHADAVELGTARTAAEVPDIFVNLVQ